MLGIKTVLEHHHPICISIDHQWWYDRRLSNYDVGSLGRTRTDSLNGTSIQGEPQNLRKLYAKQRNYCVYLLRKTKKAYYENLDERKVSENKLFCKTVKPSLSEKFNVRKRINLSENGKIVKTEIETAEDFNNFFGNNVKNLNISQYSDFDPIIEKSKIQP